MALNQGLIGRSYGPSGPYEVGREHVRQFADAIGDSSPVHRDPEAARAAGHPDVIAPPTFLTVLSFRYGADSPVADPELGLDYSRVVHGEQAFELHRPVVVGDVLSVTTIVTGIRSAGRNELVTTTSDVVDADGGAVARLVSTIVSRGTAAGGEA